MLHAPTLVLEAINALVKKDILEMEKSVQVWNNVETIIKVNNQLMCDVWTVNVFRHRLPGQDSFWIHYTNGHHFSLILHFLLLRATANAIMNYVNICACLTALLNSAIYDLDWYFGFSIEIKICGSDKDDCHKYAKCADTGPGEHECTCNPGYSGDGKTCKG